MTIQERELIYIILPLARQLKVFQELLNTIIRFAVIVRAEFKKNRSVKIKWDL